VDEVVVAVRLLLHDAALREPLSLVSSKNNGSLAILDSVVAPAIPELDCEQPRRSNPEDELFKAGLYRPWAAKFGVDEA